MEVASQIFTEGADKDPTMTGGIQKLISKGYEIGILGTDLERIRIGLDSLVRVPNTFLHRA